MPVHVGTVAASLISRLFLNVNAVVRRVIVTTDNKNTDSFSQIFRAGLEDIL
jgi:hypothetical protein